MIFRNRHAFDKMTASILVIILLSGMLTGCQKDFTYKRPTIETSQEATTTPTNEQTGTSPETAAPTDYTQIPPPVSDSSDTIGKPKLAFFSNLDQAVILGGPAPLFINGSFNRSEITGVESNQYLAVQKVQMAGTSTYADVAYSQDRTSLVFLMNKAGDLMYFDGKTLVKIAGLVSTYIYSNDGSTAAYCQGDTLYKYDCLTGTAEIVDEGGNIGYILSPNGNAIAFVRDENDILKAYYSVNSAEPIQFAADCFPIALTNDATIIYYVTQEVPELAALHNGQITHYASGFPRYSTVIFNRDCTQILYAGDQDASWFSENGEAPVIVSNIPITGIAGWQSNYSRDDIYDRAIHYIVVVDFCTEFADADTLYNLLYLAGKDTNFGSGLEIVPFTSLICFRENGETQSFPLNEYNTAQVQRNGTSLLYQTFDETGLDSQFTYIDNYLNPNVKPVTLTKYARYFDITTGGTIYYSNDIGQLFRLSGADSKVKIDTYAQLADSFDTGTTTYLYYLRDMTETGLWTLCGIEDKAGAESFVISENVAEVRICDFGVIYFTYDSYKDQQEMQKKNLYYSTDGQNFAFVMPLQYDNYYQ